MMNAAEFDELYARTWRPLLLETLAICGDLPAAKVALRFAFTELWAQRDHIDSFGPEAFLRDTAHHRALWRNRVRAFQPGTKIGPEDRATLDALAKLPVGPRRALVLATLTDLEIADVAHVLEETQTRTRELLTVGLRQIRDLLDVNEHELSERIHALDATVRATAHPAPEELRSTGTRRARILLTLGCLVVTIAVVLAGTFVTAGSEEPTARSRPVSSTVTARLLATPAELEPLGQPADWTQGRTKNNTTGSGINSFCQETRFADPRGIKALVRKFTFDGDPTRSASQTVELSRNAEQAHAGYQKALQWFGGCKQSQVQLLSTYGVTGLGDEATVLKFRGTGSTLSTYAVGIARSGNLTTWLTIRSAAARNPDTTSIVDALTSSLHKLCVSPAAGECSTTPVVRENAPPKSGEAEGMLAVADLPQVGKITAPWVGTKAGPAGSNAASTTCDRTNFVQAGARRSLSRTFLIPDAETPPRFGLTETYGLFPNTGAARSLMAQVRDRMDSCEDRDLSATVSDARSGTDGPNGSVWYMWRLRSEINDSEAVSYWMGVSRVGPYVAQVGFVPGDLYDLTADQFEALMVRARDRMFEFPTDPNQATPSSSGSPSTSGSPGSGSPSGSPSTPAASGSGG